MQLSSEEFSTGLMGLTSGIDYLKAEYEGGQAGVDKELAPKFEAKMTDAIEGTAAGPSGQGFRGDVAGVTRSSTARALGASGVAQERVGQGLDVMNSIKSQLAGHGLKTTGLSQQAGATQASAISLMAKNPTMSTILGVAGGASAAYGGYQDAMASKTAQERLATFGSVGGPPGGDVSTLSSFTQGPR
jgi:hypothetical protein